MLKPYEAYRESEEFWLPVVPSGWEVVKIKHIFGERVEKGFPEEPLLVASQNMGVVPKGVYGKRTVEATKDLHLLKLVQIGDFVISLRSFQGGIEYAYYRGIISPAYIIMVTKTDICKDFFKYLAKSDTFIKLLQNCVTGIREGQNVDYTKLKNHRIPIPPIEEQNQIVRYLDWQTSRVNTLVETKKKQIELLKEQKQAIINKAVTKGLDDSVAMKDSDVDWLGEIPEGWEVLRCKQLMVEINNRSENGLETHLSMSQKYGLVPDNKLDERRMLSESYVGGKLCNSGDIVLNKLKAHLGVFALANEPGVISPDYTVLRPKIQKINPEFAVFLLKSDNLRPELRVRVRGLVEGFWRLYTDDLFSIKFALPTIEEQIEILNYLKEYSAKADKAIETIQKEISLLAEYKTSLISSVVTGAVDVRGVEVPTDEE